MKNKFIGIMYYGGSDCYEDILNICKSTGVNTIITTPEIADNQDFIKKVNDAGLRIAINFSFFHDAQLLSENKEWYSITSKGEKALVHYEDYSLHFACPSKKEFILNKINHIKSLVLNSRIHSIILDYIRFFTNWENLKTVNDFKQVIDGCYCDDCLNSFCDFTGINRPIDIETFNERAEWIKEHHHEKFGLWKSHIITNIVKTIKESICFINPQIKLGLNIIPWKDDDYCNGIMNFAGQNIKSLIQYSDFLTPMTYMQSLKKSYSWFKELISYYNIVSNNRIIPAIQVEKYFNEPAISGDDFLKMLDIIKAHNTEGLILFYWNQFLESSEKQNILKNFLAID